MGGAGARGGVRHAERAALRRARETPGTIGETLESSRKSLSVTRVGETTYAHTESRRFTPALRVTPCSRRLNGTYGRKRASGQYFWPNAPSQDVPQSRRGPGQPFAGSRNTTDAELALLFGRTDTGTKSASPFLQVAQGAVEEMADRSTRHAQSLVNGEVFETARLLRLVCAKSIRAPGADAPVERPDIYLQLTCPFYGNGASTRGADHICH